MLRSIYLPSFKVSSWFFHVIVDHQKAYKHPENNFDSPLSFDKFKLEKLTPSQCSLGENKDCTRYWKISISLYVRTAVIISCWWMRYVIHAFIYSHIHSLFHFETRLWLCSKKCSWLTWTSYLNYISYSQ